MSYYDPRGRTPQGRAEQLAEGRADAERAARRPADLAHMPGSGTSVFDRVQYWDDQVAEYEARWDRADRAWRGLRASFPPYPEPGEAAQVAAAQGERDRLAGEAARCRARRDEALEECETLRRGLRDLYGPHWQG